MILDPGKTIVLGIIAKFVDALVHVENLDGKGAELRTLLGRKLKIKVGNAVFAGFEIQNLRTDRIRVVVGHPAAAVRLSLGLKSQSINDHGQLLIRLAGIERICHIDIDADNIVCPLRTPVRRACRILKFQL